MSGREVRYRWEWDLQSDREILWSLLADTNRFDRDSGVPDLTHLRDRDRELSNGRCEVQVSQFGVALRYRQEPFEWDFPSRFAVTRNYHSGPLACLRVEATLDPRPGGGTHFIYEVDATPRNLLGRIAIPIQIGLIFGRRFERTSRRYDALAGQEERSADTSGGVRLTAGGRERAHSLRAELATERVDRELLDHLFHVVLEGDDLVAGRLRPYELADEWGADRRETLGLFLRATRAGLLGFRWDVLCPLCRVAKGSSAQLSDLPFNVHCDTCNIDYTANFARSVELTFRTSEAIRAVDTDEYCIGSPMATPHVVAQRLVAPMSRTQLDLALEQGRYRVRAHDSRGSQLVSASADGPSDLTLELGDDGWPDNEPAVATEAAFELVNGTDSERLFLLERMAWGDQAVTAADVTAMQEFRDLFADEALRPGQQIAVGSLTVVFTDLRASTRLYRDIGDAIAFGRVLDHFDVLRECVVAGEGAIVKTIGDSVMAVFRTPAPALDAMLAAQQRLADPDRAGGRLDLKVGIHHGPCIAVTLNDQLDYFGSTVNLASRLEGLSTAEDVVISGAVRTDPTVETYLRDAADVDLEPMTAPLRGFDGEFELWRVRRRRAAAAAQP